MRKTGRANLTRATRYRRTPAQVVEGLDSVSAAAGRKQAEGGRQVADPAEREMFERVAKLVKTDRVRSWRLDQAARSIFLTEFVSGFFLAMRYFFKPKVTR